VFVELTHDPDIIAGVLEGKYLRLEQGINDPVHGAYMDYPGPCRMVDILFYELWQVKGSTDIKSEPLA